MFTYVCTHGHRTRHDPLRRAAGRQGTHDIAHVHAVWEVVGSAGCAAEEKGSIGGRLRGADGKLNEISLPPGAAAVGRGRRGGEAGMAEAMAAAETAAEVVAGLVAEETAEARAAAEGTAGGEGGGGEGGEAVGR